MAISRPGLTWMVVRIGPQVLMSSITTQPCLVVDLTEMTPKITICMARGGRMMAVYRDLAHGNTEFMVDTNCSVDVASQAMHNNEGVRSKLDMIVQ